MTLEEGKVTQTLRKVISFSYKPLAQSQVYIDMVLSGRRSNPTIIIKPKFKLLEKDEGQSKKIKVTKIDRTQYENPRTSLEDVYTTLYYGEAKDVEDTKKDIYEPENKKHNYTYIVEMEINGTYSRNIILYQQEKVHMSSAEVIIILISVAFLGLSAMFIAFSIKTMKRVKGNSLEKEVKSGKMEQLLE